MAATAGDRQEREREVIVVGVDHSAGAEAALRFALTEARLRKARLRVVHTWMLGATGAGWGLAAAPYITAEFSELGSAAEAALDATIQEVVADASDVQIERRVVQGAPASVLLDESRQADLLVVGSRGLGGFRGLLLGSVSQQCAQHAGCPIVIVHAPADDEMET